MGKAQQQIRQDILNINSKETMSCSSSKRNLKLLKGELFG